MQSCMEMVGILVVFFIPPRWQTWHNLPIVTDQILGKSGPKRVDLGFAWGFVGLCETVFSEMGY